MAKGKKPPRRFHIRDMDTKEVKESFTSETAARNYLNTMKFGLSNFYEVYDSENFEVVYFLIGKSKKINRWGTD